ncbi:MAG: hypothetical protein ABIH76_00525 [Candidatus Bathyarchaeota archaeon]
MVMKFGDKPAILEVHAYGRNEVTAECIHYEFLSKDQKAKLKAMSVKDAVYFVLDNCIAEDELTETYKRDIRCIVEKKPNYRLVIGGLEELLAIKYDPRTGNVLADERDKSICDPRYWVLAEDAKGTQFHLCEVHVLWPPAPH